MKLNATEKKAVKEMAAEVRKHLEKGDNISISVHNYGLTLSKVVLNALRKEGLPIDEQATKYSFMGYVTFRKPKPEQKPETDAAQESK